MGQAVNVASKVGAGLALATVALTGCTASPMSSRSPEPTRAAPASSAATSPAPSTSASPAVDAEPESDATGSVDESASSETTELATRAVSLFCRPDVAYDAWIAELYPVLTQTGAIAYESVDPANVLCRSVTGPASVRDGDEAFTMRILVPTDAGDYSVYVHRPTAASTWGVERITPLASE